MSDFWRFVAVLFRWVPRVLLGAASWFLAGTWWIGRASKAHPTYGKMDLPSDQVIDAAMVAPLGTPWLPSPVRCRPGLAEWLAKRWTRSRTRRSS